MKLFLRTIFVLALVSAGNVRADAMADIAKANQEYSAERFGEAVALYQSAVDTGVRNAAVFYNLGNACFRAGETGRAILNYERALALKPNHPEARANLHLARDKARALELQPKWWDQFVARATPSQLSIAAAAGFWAAMFCFAAWMMARRRAPLRFVASLLALLVAGVSVAALYALETGRNGRDLAIVTATKIEARIATADNAGSVLRLPPGSEIRILSLRGDWIYAALPNDLRGWIPAGGAERVRL